MAIFLMAGCFRITVAQPEGDSIRFTPADPASAAHAESSVHRVGGRRRATVESGHEGEKTGYRHQARRASVCLT